MILNIDVINVDAVTKPTAKGSYIQLDVTFKRLDTGKVEGKKIMSFTNKDVYEKMAKATKGTQLAVTTEKNEKSGYWDWTAVNPLGQSESSTTSNPQSGTKQGFSSPKSNYETPEERAARQVLIVRQSSLAQAVDSLKSDKKLPDKDEVLDLAEAYAAWVFQSNTQLDKPEVNFADMDDDTIPY
jgi:hypothetical protein